MKIWLLLLAFSGCLNALALAAPPGDWRLALPGWKYSFPRDHGSHPEFKTEWWYFTGNLVGENGRRFGYQLTFFRQGVRPPSLRTAVASRFVIDDLKFAHFALSEVEGSRFRFEQKLARGAFGEAGFGPEKLAWIDSWQLQILPNGAFQLVANTAGTQLTLELVSAKPWSIHGQNGISQKADGEGRASHYYSGTRLRSTGSLQVDGRAIKVTGESWFDHEWGSNQLTSQQVGWNWFSVQLNDGSELMLYQMRTSNGGTDPNSSGTFVDSAGQVRHLNRDEYQLTAREFWTSKKSGGRYPIAWDVAVPSLDLTLRVSTPIPAQELVLKPIAYWEGLIDLAGTRAGKAVSGHGYLELTGYSGPLVGLSQ